MKRATLILNWIIIGCAVLSILTVVAASLLAKSEEPILFRGADGPTVVFVSTRFEPEVIVIPLLMALVLLMNTLVIRKQEKQIANQGVDPAR
jgi:Na+-transporting methylmalonyl-CoA/oxaloacetate decarboxylase beta subunit